jgi:hypothetical protein
MFQSEALLRFDLILHCSIANVALLETGEDNTCNSRRRDAGTFAQEADLCAFEAVTIERVTVTYRQCYATHPVRNVFVAFELSSLGASLNMYVKSLT